MYKEVTNLSSATTFRCFGGVNNMASVSDAFLGGLPPEMTIPPCLATGRVMFRQQLEV